MEIRAGEQIGADIPIFQRGSTMPVHVAFNYRGLPQNGKFKFEIGGGVWPTFTPEKTYSEVDVTGIDGAMDFEAREFEAQYVIPTNISLGVKSIRGTLRTLTDVTDEKDTRYSAIEIVA